MKRGRRKRDKRRSRWDRWMSLVCRQVTWDYEFTTNLVVRNRIRKDFDDSPVWAVNGVGKLPTER